MFLLRLSPQHLQPATGTLRGCCLHRGAVCACQCDYDGENAFTTLATPASGRLAAVQSTQARYGNEGWGLIIISSLPVRDEPLLPLFFPVFSAFTHSGERLHRGLFRPGVLECAGRRGAGSGSTLWLNAASCGYSAGTFKPFIISLVFT